MLLSAVSVLVVAQRSSEIPEGLMNNPVYLSGISLPDVDKETKQTCPSAPHDVIEVRESNDSAVVHPVA
jgi:hypothetical protein